MNQLPAEILGRIFEYVTHPEDLVHLLSIHREPEPIENAKLLTRVCSAWRDVAMGWPRLWYMLIERPGYSLDSGTSRLFLSRSGASPLHVHLQFPMEFHEGTVFRDICDTEPDRIRELHVNAAFDNHLSTGMTVRSLISLQLPNLTFLSLHGSSSVSGNAVAEVTQLILFGGDTSKLRALVLTFDVPPCIVPGNTFRSLLHLRIITRNTSGPLSMNRLVDLLRNCPRLATLALELGGDVDSLVVRYIPNLVPVPLPSLHFIWFESMPTKTALAILACIEPSLSAKIRLTNLRPVSDHTADSITPASTTHPIMRPPQLDIIVQADPELESKRAPISFYIIARSLQLERGAWFHILTKPQREQGGYSSIRHVFRQLDAEGLTVLHITISGAPAAAAKRFSRAVGTVLAHTPCVLELVVRHTEARSSDVDLGPIFQALTATLIPAQESGSEAGSAGTVPVPHLHSLHIELPFATSVEPFIQGLEGISGARAQIGHPISFVSGRIWHEEVLLTERGCMITTVEAVSCHPMRDIDCTQWLVKNEYWELYEQSDLPAVDQRSMVSIQRS